MKRIGVLSLILLGIIFYCMNNNVTSQDKVSLLSISSTASTSIKEVFDSNNISFAEVSLDETSNTKRIEFELENNSNFDATVDILINGEKEYHNEYISITCSEINEIKKHSKQKGIITISLIKQPEEDQEIDYNISINANQKM